MNKSLLGAGEMAQQLRALATLTKDTSLVSQHPQQVAHSHL